MALRGPDIDSPLTVTVAGRTFSYQGQDLFVVEACHGMRGGYFLDSGASTGVRGSNTKLLESEYGWSGICVEPNDAMYAQLVTNRTCVCLNCCLYDHDGSVDFFEAGEVYGGVLKDYVPAHLAFARRFADRAAAVEEPSVLRTVSKPARTIRSVLRSVGAPRVIDYWSLDTEGSELVLLRSFPFDEYHVRVLTVEHNNTYMREAIRSLLATRGYQMVQPLGIDDGYAWVGHSQTQTWRSRVWYRSL